LATAAPTAATDRFAPAPNGSTRRDGFEPTPNGRGRRYDFEPSAYRGVSRNEALRLARDARSLPEDVRWFYLRALRAAARRDEFLSIDEAERPAELARLLEAAHGAEEVVGAPGRGALSAVALALAAEGRRVTIFDPVGEPSELADYLALVPPDIRARVEYRAASGSVV
jgi:hypothetical protein